MTKSTKKTPAKKAAKKTPAPKKQGAVATSGKVGRPTKFTAAVLSKLDMAFMCGATREEASVFAGIGRSTLERYISDHPEYRDRIQALQGQPRLMAKALVVGELQKGSLPVAWEVLERGRVDGYTKPQEPAKGPGVQVNVTTPMAPGETEEGRKALEALHALFSGRALPGPEHQGKG